MGNTFANDIRQRNEVTDIFQLLTLLFNKRSIATIIKIVKEIAKQLRLYSKIVRDKMILIRDNLLTV